jgi:ABC-type sugar transport system permease subunit
MRADLKSEIHDPRSLRLTWWWLQRSGAPYVFVAPFVILFAVFMAYPLVQSISMAFHVTNGPRSSVFVGFDNFRFLLRDPDFWTALRNTTVFALFSVFLQLPLSLSLALLLNARWVKGRNVFRLAFFSPHLVGQVFVAVLFSLIFIPRFGILNRAIHAVSGWGLDTMWLMNPRLVMPALVLTSLWMYVGFNMIYFLAALQNVDQTLYEAAQVDGANRWRQFVHVTVPGIKPVAVFVVLMSTIGSFQLFELPFVLLNGSGPNNSGLTIVMYLYNTGFSTGDLGYASAIGWALVLITLTISLVQASLAGLWRRDS